MNGPRPCDHIRKPEVVKLTETRFLDWPRAIAEDQFARGFWESFR